MRVYWVMQNHGKKLYGKDVIISLLRQFSTKLLPNRSEFCSGILHRVTCQLSAVGWYDADILINRIALQSCSVSPPRFLAEYRGSRQKQLGIVLVVRVNCVVLSCDIFPVQLHLSSSLALNFGGVAQWLGRRSVVGELSLIYAWSMVDVLPLCE